MTAPVIGWLKREWRQKKDKGKSALSVALPIALYLILFHTLSGYLLHDLEALPFIDDDWRVVQMYRGHVDNPSRALLHGFFERSGTDGSYRQLYMFVITKSFAKHGLSAEPIHAFCVGLHQLNCLLLFILVILLTRSVIPAIAASLLFLVYPTPVEAVAWLCAGYYIMIGFFGLVMMICATQAARPDRLGWLAIGLAMLAYLGGCLTIESGVGLPLAFAAIYLSRNPRDRIWWRRGIVSAAGFFLFLKIIDVDYFSFVKADTNVLRNYIELVQWTFLPFIGQMDFHVKLLMLLLAIAVALLALRRNPVGLLLLATVLLLILPVSRVYVSIRSLYFNCILASIVWTLLLANWPSDRVPKPSALVVWGLLAGVFLYEHVQFSSGWIDGGRLVRQTTNLLKTSYPKIDKNVTVYLSGTKSFRTWHQEPNFQCYLACLYPRSTPKGVYDPYADDYRVFLGQHGANPANRNSIYLHVKDGYVWNMTSAVRSSPDLYFSHRDIQGGALKQYGELIQWGVGQPAFVSFPDSQFGANHRDLWIVVRMRGGRTRGMSSVAQITLDGVPIGRTPVDGNGIFSRSPESERRDYVLRATLPEREMHRIDVALLNDDQAPEIRESIDLFIWSIGVYVSPPEGNVVPVISTGASPSAKPLEQHGFEHKDFANVNGGRVEPQHNWIILYAPRSFFEIPVQDLKPGAYEISIQALNGLPAPIRMDVRSTTATLAHFAFDSGNNQWSIKTQSAQLPPDTKALRFTFVNDGLQDGLDRNAIVRKVILAGPK